VLAERVRVEATSGAPLVRLPGADRSIALADAATVPVGSTIDATRGHVELTSVRDRSGRVQTGEFWGGRFVVRQTAGRMPYTDLVLRASFAGCPAARSASRGAPLASAARRRRGRRSVVRSLWGRDRSGRFRTHGRDSVATVRGTTWLVQDRCDGTLTRVLEGSVAVRDPRRGRTVLVRAGQRHFVRHASR
jgi:hypothetical protein